MHVQGNYILKTSYYAHRDALFPAHKGAALDGALLSVTGFCFQATRLWEP